MKSFKVPTDLLTRSDRTRQKQFALLKPYLPKYFSSEWSHSQFRLPPPAPTASRLPFSLSAAASANSAGPPTVEDDVCLCIWVDHIDTMTPGQDIPGGSSKGKGVQDIQERNSPEPQIVALTRSGGWYRISLNEPGGAALSNQPPAPSFGLSADSTSRCRLVEYRRFGSKDGW